MNDKINIKSYGKILEDKERSKILHYYQCEYIKCKEQIINAYNSGLPGCVYELPIDPLTYDIWNEKERNECCYLLINKLRKNGYTCCFELPSHIIIQIKKKTVEETYTQKDADIKKFLLSEDKKTKRTMLKKEYEL